MLEGGGIVFHSKEFHFPLTDKVSDLCDQDETYQ